MPPPPRPAEPLCNLNGHVSSVLHCDWSVDGSILMSNCSSNEVLFWNPKTGKQFKSDTDYRNAGWDSVTCTMGFGVMGILGRGSSHLINACCRSQSGDYVVSAGDNGLVKLFNYPCVTEDAPNLEYAGHSSHVTSVRFAFDDRFLLSAGGYDRAVFQFSTHKIMEGDDGREPPPPRKAKVKVPVKVWGPLSSDGKTFGWIEQGAPRPPPMVPAPTKLVVADRSPSQIRPNQVPLSKQGRW